MTRHPRMSVEQLNAYFARVFPGAGTDRFRVTEVRAPTDGPRGHDGGAVLSLVPEPGQLRPGGTVSGPTLMMLADAAVYLAVLAQIGPVPLAVTTNLEIHFLRKAVLGTLHADCTLVKVGRKLAVGTVAITSEGVSGRVAQATATYALPSNWPALAAAWDRDGTAPDPWPEGFGAPGEVRAVGARDDG